MMVTLYLIKLIDVRKNTRILRIHRILYKRTCMGFYIKFHPNQQLNEKAKTTNNGSFLELFKTLTARVLSSLKIIGLYAFEFLNLINTAVRVLNITSMHGLQLCVILEKPTEALIEITTVIVFFCVLGILECLSKCACLS